MTSPLGPGFRQAVRSRLWLAALVMIVIVGGCAAAAARLGPQSVAPHWTPASNLSEYTAVLHVHSQYSHDARGHIADIAAAAARLGVRVVFLTDHNTLAPLEEGMEGWHGDTLVLIGSEISTGSGSLLLLQARPGVPVRARGWALSSLLSRYRTDDAILIVAHPDHPRRYWRGPVSGFDGMEVMNLFDLLVVAPLPRTLRGLLAYPVNPRMAILSVVDWPRQSLARWDSMNRERRTIGVLALDAHGGVAITDEATVPFPSYETMFGIGQLHFVTRDALRRDAADRTLVYRALRHGQFFNAFDGLAPASGFRFELRGQSRVALMGENVALRAGQTFEIQVPPVNGAVVRLLRDGEVQYEASAGPSIRIPVDQPGAYRVEVDLEVNLFPISGARRFPWIFSNPIYVSQ